MDKEIQGFVKQIKKKNITVYDDIPKELWFNLNIVAISRKMGLRTTSTKGFDVIKNHFFVYEKVLVKNRQSGLTGEVMPIWEYISSNYDSFEEFYSFVDGDIYKNACYFGYTFSKDLISKYEISTDKLNFKALLDDNDTLNNCIPLELEDYNDGTYEEIEKYKSNIKRWINKFLKCESYAELIKTIENHRKSQDSIPGYFYLWNYVNIRGKSVFPIVMELVNNGYGFTIEKALPFIFEDIEALHTAYNYCAASKSTNSKHNREFSSFLKKIEDDNFVVREKKYFDDLTHYFCIESEYFYDVCDNMWEEWIPFATKNEYFETFKDFASYLKNDLSDCDLSNFRDSDINHEYKTNENTKYPQVDISTLTKVVEKKYNREKGIFQVHVYWKNEYGRDVYERTRTFIFFFDFLKYCEGNLSGADLLFCDGLVNIEDSTDIDFSGAIITSKIQKRFCHEDESPALYPENKLIVYPNIEENLKKTELVLKDNHIEEPILIANEPTEDKIYYISDIHILHTLARKNAKNQADCIYFTQKIIDTMFAEFGNSLFEEKKVLLIAGDISSDTVIFELFVELLHKYIQSNELNFLVCFVLGNHELWSYPDDQLDQIVERYKSILVKRNMVLIQDEVVFIDERNRLGTISSSELLTERKSVLRDKIKKARTIIFGGIGFSGCNQSFNANSGIYMNSITREEEVQLSKNFERIYDKVVEYFGDKHVIVFTHMHIEEWKSQYEFHKNFIYVSGHSHLNKYYDDGEIRFYSDNQIGYFNDSPRLKYFYVDNTYDTFSDYEDGIYSISREDYIDFYRGKNLEINFNRKFHKLYLLKKHGYYSFIIENNKGKLTMLNGGQLKALKCNIIEYYFENMDVQIEQIINPLTKYQQLQKQVASEIKKIGGRGYIHGAIIDVDNGHNLFGWGGISYNHIYINPVDLTITPYYATDIIDKYVYNSFPALIYDNCPELYENYIKQLSVQDENAVIIKAVGKEALMTPPVQYYDTDIYKASREIRKMQKLNSNVLSTWIENLPNLPTPPMNEIKKLESKKVIKKSDEANKPENFPDIGTTKMMKCGMKATVIKISGGDLTIQFEDGLVRKHISIESFYSGDILHVKRIR